MGPDKFIFFRPKNSKFSKTVHYIKLKLKTSLDIYLKKILNEVLTSEKGYIEPNLLKHWVTYEWKKIMKNNNFSKVIFLVKFYCKIIEISLNILKIPRAAGYSFAYAEEELPERWNFDAFWARVNLYLFDLKSKNSQKSYVRSSWYQKPY